MSSYRVLRWEAQTTIDNQIEEVQKIADEQKRALRQRRNTMAPISSLPAELLTKIFLHAQDAQEELARLSVYDVKHTHAAIFPAYSRVCREWRALSIGYGPLWTFIDSTRTAWATGMITRARGIPLNVRCDPKL